MAWAGYTVAHTSTPPAPPPPPRVGAGWWAKKAIHGHTKIHQYFGTALVSHHS